MQSKIDLMSDLSTTYRTCPTLSIIENAKEGVFLLTRMSKQDCHWTACWLICISHKLTIVTQLELELVTSLSIEMSDEA